KEFPPGLTRRCSFVAPVRLFVGVLFSFGHIRKAIPRVRGLAQTQHPSLTLSVKLRLMDRAHHRISALDQRLPLEVPVSVRGVENLRQLTKARRADRLLSIDRMTAHLAEVDSETEHEDLLLHVRQRRKGTLAGWHLRPSGALGQDVT